MLRAAQDTWLLLAQAWFSLLLGSCHNSPAAGDNAHRPPPTSRRGMEGRPSHRRPRAPRVRSPSAFFPQMGLSKFSFLGHRLVVELMAQDEVGSKSIRPAEGETRPRKLPPRAAPRENEGRAGGRGGGRSPGARGRWDPPEAEDDVGCVSPPLPPGSEGTAPHRPWSQHPRPQTTDDGVSAVSAPWSAVPCCGSRGDISHRHTKTHNTRARVHTHLHTCTHIHAHTLTTQTHAYTQHTCSHIYIYTTHTYIRTLTQIYTRTCSHTHTLTCLHTLKHTYRNSHLHTHAVHLPRTQTHSHISVHTHTL